MRIRDILIIILVFSSMISIGSYILGEPQRFKKEYLISSNNLDKEGLIIIDVPARTFKLFIIPDGDIEIEIWKMEGSNVEKNILKKIYNENGLFTYTFTDPAYLKIIARLDRGERGSLSIEIYGLRTDLLYIGGYLSIITILLYLLLTILAMRLKIDWV